MSGTLKVGFHMIVNTFKFMREHLLLLAVSLLLACTAASAAVNPNTMSIARQDVDGETQFSGHFGAGWTVSEIREEAELSCRGVGQKMTGFALGELSARKGQAFLATCG
jgi:hypothetical protein